MSAGVTVDAAGARMGGAAKFFAELTTYLQRRSRDDVTVLGEGESLTPRWLLRREMLTAHNTRRVALNNASFASPGGRRIVLLRNALHFASPGELEGLGFNPSRALRVQTLMVRALARRADQIVVPCGAMAERVASHLPKSASNIAVRMHPVSPRLKRLDPSVRSPRILVPILNAPYKRLDEHLDRLLTGLAKIGDTSTMIVSTAQRGEFRSAIADHKQVNFVGALSEVELSRHWQEATAIYFPTRLESFGYPLAEARVAGIPVIAQDTAQNREIAGPSLHGFVQDDIRSLAFATQAALSGNPDPDAAPFDPDLYFNWLLAVNDG